MKKICKFCGKEYNWEKNQLNWTKNGPGIANGNIRSDLFCCYECGKKDRLKKSEQTKLKRYGDKNYNNKTKNIETCLKKYGVKYITQTENFKEKSKETCLRKYGTKHSFQSENNKIKSKATKKLKYNNENYNNQEKIKLTNLDKYGVENIFQCEAIKDKIKQINFNKFGCINPMQNKEIQQKSSKRKKELKTFSKSKEEDLIFTLLSQKFSNVERQYSSEKYPFACDFYIPELDLYIEYQGYWTHGKYKRQILRAFNSTNILHQNILTEWKIRAKTSKIYKSAINVWTNTDPLKRQIAKQNNLNWIEFFDIKEVKIWLSDN